jgi:hypothetical protein
MRVRSHPDSDNSRSMGTFLNVAGDPWTCDRNIIDKESSVGSFC